MENDDLVAQLREADRGEAASWLAFAQVDAWVAPMFGLWAFAFVCVAGSFAESTRVFGMLLVTLAPIAFVLWDKRRRPVYPTGRMPREFWVSTVALVVLALAVTAVGMGVHFASNLWIAAIVTGLCTTAAVAFYGQLYARDADRLRRRIGS